MPNDRLEKIKKADEYKKNQKSDHDIEEEKIDNEIRKLYPRAKELCVLLKELDTKGLLTDYSKLSKKFYVNQENKIGFAYVDEKTFWRSSDKLEYDPIFNMYINPTFDNHWYYGSSIAICIKSSLLKLALTESGKLLKNGFSLSITPFSGEKTFLRNFDRFEREVFDFIDNLEVGDKSK